MPTLITGGTGKTGSRVAARLTATGRAVRLGSRSGDVRFDWEDDNSWRPALRGCTSAYVTFAPDLAFPGASDTISAFAKTAVEAGVTRLVLLSGRGEVGAQLSEQRLMESGADWTVVRCAFFAQNCSETSWVESIRAGVLELPGNTAEPIVDLEDVADVAAAAFADDRHVGAVYECTGPRLITFDEAMREIGRASAREVDFREVSPAEFAAGLVASGLPDRLASDLAELFAGILDGHNATVADGVQRALGREPHDFTDYVRRTARTGVWRG